MYDFKSRHWCSLSTFFKINFFVLCHFYIFAYEFISVEQRKDKARKHMRKKNPTDRELLIHIRTDASNGIKELMDQYSGLVYYIVEKRLYGRTQDIEECVADVFIEFYSKLDTIDLEKGTIKGYLTIMSSRRAIDHYRKLSGIQEQGCEDLEIPDFGTAESPEEITMDSEEREFLLKEVEDLGEPDSSIIFRRFFLLQSVKEIAEGIGMKSNSVTKRITRALVTLKDRLEEHYFE